MYSRIKRKKSKKEWGKTLLLSTLSYEPAKNGSVGFFSQVTSDRTQSNGLNLHQGRFRFNVRKNWNSLSREVVKSSFLERLKRCVDLVWRDIYHLLMGLCRPGWSCIRCSLRSFLTQRILWLYGKQSTSEQKKENEIIWEISILWTRRKKLIGFNIDCKKI